MSREDQVRDPAKYKGVRVRLRTALRAAGVEGKIKTGIRRRGPTLVVTVETEEARALVEAQYPTFEGLPVVCREARKEAP